MYENHTITDIFLNTCVKKSLKIVTGVPEIQVKILFSYTCVTFGPKADTGVGYASVS